MRDLFFPHFFGDIIGLKQSGEMAPQLGHRIVRSGAQIHDESRQTLWSLRRTAEQIDQRPGVSAIERSARPVQQLRALLQKFFEREHRAHLDGHGQDPRYLI